MFAIFLGERMIGSGTTRHLATARRPAAGDRRDGRARSCAPARRRRGPAQRGADAARALRRSGLAAPSCSTSCSRICGRPRRHAARAQLAQAVDGARPRCGRRSGSAAAWPILLVELSLRRDGARAAAGAGPDPQRACCRASGWPRAGLRVRLRLRRVRARQEGRPRLLPHRPSRRGRPAGSCATWTSRSRSPSFFPAANEVREEVDDYLDDLAKESSQLKVTHYDFDIDPIKAKEYGVTTNGILVFVRGAKKEQLGLPRRSRGREDGAQDAGQGGPAAPAHGRQAAAHGRLHARPRRAHLGARRDDTDKRAGIAMLRDGLLDQTYDVRTVSPADGLDARGAQGDHRAGDHRAAARRSSPRSTRRSTASSTAAAAC